MVTCPKCHSGSPDGMRFCLQCGSSLAPPPPPQKPVAQVNPAAQVPHPQTATVPLKIAATPVMSPRPGGGNLHPRPSFHDEKVEIDEEALKKSFERHVIHPGAIICRFCKGPLDLSGDFCEQCGAPVVEAAPPGVAMPKPAPPPPPAPTPMQAAPPQPPAPAPSKPVQSAPPPPPPRSSNASGVLPSTTTPPPGRLAPPTTSRPTPLPPPPAAPEEEPSSGLMGRLKGMFKKT